MTTTIPAPEPAVASQTQLAPTIDAPVKPTKVTVADPTAADEPDSYAASYPVVDSFNDKTPAHWNAIEIDDEIFEFANSVVRQSFIGTIDEFSALLK